ncbi:uncharacterized protein LOC131206014 [Anopheles bellator]|uniref:uncharacterized protein LOC131206014 n=1 Tax=Anopheles bellator TaxID=139047 RepID=UPI002648BDE0|nr:uncharacterized protein LOC131206014 [Anopheles bellator]
MRINSGSQTQQKRVQLAVVSSVPAATVRNIGTSTTLYTTIPDDAVSRDAHGSSSPSLQTTHHSPCNTPNSHHHHHHATSINLNNLNNNSNNSCRSSLTANQQHQVYYSSLNNNRKLDILYDIPAGKWVMMSMRSCFNGSIFIVLTAILCKGPSASGTDCFRFGLFRVCVSFSFCKFDLRLRLCFVTASSPLRPI